MCEKDPALSPRAPLSREAVKAVQTAARQPLPLTARLEEIKNKFRAAMEDDLNAPKALAVVWETLRGAELNAAEKVEFLKFADGILALDVFRAPQEENNEELPQEVKDLLARRAEARAAKDYKKSDELRAALAAAGYAVKDTPQGQQTEKIK